MYDKQLKDNQCNIQKQATSKSGAAFTKEEALDFVLNKRKAGEKLVENVEPQHSTPIYDEELKSYAKKNTSNVAIEKESIETTEEKPMKTQDDLLKYLTEVFGKENNEH